MIRSDGFGESVRNLCEFLRILAADIGHNSLFWRQQLPTLMVCTRKISWYWLKVSKLIDILGSSRKRQSRHVTRSVNKWQYSKYQCPVMDQGFPRREEPNLEGMRQPIFGNSSADKGIKILKFELTQECILGTPLGPPLISYDYWLSFEKSFLLTITKSRAQDK